MGRAVAHPYTWRVVPGRMLLDVGAGPAPAACHIDDDDRTITLPGNLHPLKLAAVVTKAMKVLKGEPVVEPTIIIPNGLRVLPPGFVRVSGCFICKLAG